MNILGNTGIQSGIFGEWFVQFKVSHTVIESSFIFVRGYVEFLSILRPVNPRFRVTKDGAGQSRLHTNSYGPIRQSRAEWRLFSFLARSKLQENHF